MENLNNAGYKDSETVNYVVGEMSALFSPQTVYLYNQRVGANGHTSGFKLCVVAETDDKRRLESDIYRYIDCDIPFDVLLYTPEEWQRLTDQPGSFAAKIKKTGLIVYV